MNKLKSLVFAAAAVMMVMPPMVVAEEDTPATESASKRPPKKEANGYTDPTKAIEVAQAWDQPIIAFIDLSGDRTSSRVRAVTFGNQDFVKNFILPNAVYFHYTVPSEKMKPQRGQKVDKNKPPKPNFDKLKPEMKAALQRFASGGARPGNMSFPVIAVLKPNGQPVGTILVSPEDFNLVELADDFKQTIEGAQLKWNVTPKMESMLNKERKRLKALEKRKPKTN